MSIAKKYINEIERAQDDTNSIIQILIKYKPEIEQCVITDMRSHNIHFKDGSWLEKIYIGNEHSRFVTHRKQFIK